MTIALKPWHLYALGGIAFVLYYGARANAANPSGSNSTGVLGDIAGSVTRAVSKAVEDVGAGVVDGTASGIGSLAGTLLTRVNPFDDRNIVNQAVQGAGRSASGVSAWTLGGWVWDKTHAGFNPSAGKYCTNFMGFGCK